jgi:hypothetical protein
MKAYFTFIFLFIFYFVHAQTGDKELKEHFKKVARSKASGSVICSLDTIFNKGIPYAVLKEKFRGLRSDYILFSLTGVKLIDMPYEFMDDNILNKRTDYIAFLFLGSGKKGKIPLERKTKVEKVIVEFDLVKNNQVNLEGENKFVTIYPTDYDAASVKDILADKNVKPYDTLDRKRFVPIYLYGLQLKRDTAVIGTIEKANSPNGADIVYGVSFYLPDGTKVATATGINSTAKEWRVVTMKDGRVHKVKTTSVSQETQLAKFLWDSHYL